MVIVAAAPVAVDRGPRTTVLRARPGPDGAVGQRNCPFHALVAEHRALSCSLNHRLLRGVLAGAGAAGAGPAAEVQPPGGSCCVLFVRVP